MSIPRLVYWKASFPPVNFGNTTHGLFLELNHHPSWPKNSFFKHPEITQSVNGGASATRKMFVG
jgi:hypothetical protein